MIIDTARIYDKPRGSRGCRVLVDRLWPRGLRKEDVKVDLWLKDIAPSNALRRWFGHEPARWEQFKQRYFNELDKRPDLVRQLLNGARHGAVVLLYGAKDTQHNQAVALKEYLERMTTKT